jgi:hypothetical protein
MASTRYLTNSYESIAKYKTRSRDTVEIIHESLSATRSDNGPDAILKPMGVIPIGTLVDRPKPEGLLSEWENEVQHSQGQTPSFSGSAWASRLLSGNEETRS